MLGRARWGQTNRGSTPASAAPGRLEGCSPPGPPLVTLSHLSLAHSTGSSNRRAKVVSRCMRASLGEAKTCRQRMDTSKLGLTTRFFDYVCLCCQSLPKLCAQWSGQAFDPLLGQPIKGTMFDWLYNSRAFWESSAGGTSWLTTCKIPGPASGSVLWQWTQEQTKRLHTCASKYAMWCRFTTPWCVPGCSWGWWRSVSRTPLLRTASSCNHQTETDVCTVEKRPPVGAGRWLFRCALRPTEIRKHRFRGVKSLEKQIYVNRPSYCYVFIHPTIKWRSRMCWKAACVWNFSTRVKAHEVLCRPYKASIDMQCTKLYASM